MEYHAEIKAPHKPGKGGVIEVGTDFLEAYFDVSRPTLAQWKEKGCPQLKRGKWDFIAVLRWRGGLEGTGEGEDEEESPNDYLRKVKAEADLKERQVKLLDIDLGKARGEILDVEDVKVLFSDAVLNAKNLLLALPSKAAPQLAGVSVLLDFKKTLEGHIVPMTLAKDEKAVQKIISQILEEFEESEGVGEISEVLSHIVEESLRELGELEVKGDDRESGEDL